MTYQVPACLGLDFNRNPLYIHTRLEYLRNQSQLESDLPVRDYCTSRGNCLYYLKEMDETLFLRINFSIFSIMQESKKTICVHVGGI